MLVEIISTTFDQALQAKKYGADRIELVNGMLEEGLTPSLGVNKKNKRRDWNPFSRNDKTSWKIFCLQ